MSPSQKFEGSCRATLALLLLVFGAFCGAPTPCYRPGYEDLSRWAPSPAELIAVCGVSTRAILSAESTTSVVLTKSYDGEVNEVVWVRAQLLRLAGTGPLTLSIVNNYILGAGVPDCEGHTYAFARLPTGRATISFLGEAGTEPLRFEVRDVSISTVEVTQ